MYDFVNKRVGFAESAKDSSSICQADLPMDLSYDGESIPATEVERTPSDAVETADNDDNISNNTVPSSKEIISPVSAVDMDVSTTSEPLPQMEGAAGTAGLTGSQQFAISTAVLGILFFIVLLVVRRKRQQKQQTKSETQFEGIDKQLNNRPVISYDEENFIY